MPRCWPALHFDVFLASSSACRTPRRLPSVHTHRASAHANNVHGRSAVHSASGMPLCTQSHEHALQVDAAKADLDTSVVTLRNQLNLEQQAHTQTQQREAAANKAYQEAAVQLQMRVQDVRSLTGELQATRSSQHDADLEVERVQQQLDAVADQRCAPQLRSRSVRPAHPLLRGTGSMRTVFVQLDLIA